MPETDFQLIYDGPALSSGRMAVRDLAPALLALGEVFTEAAGVLYPELDTTPTLTLEATEHGSFAAHLILDASGLWGQMVNIFGSGGVIAIVNLKESVGGLLEFTKWLKGRRITKQTPAGEGHTIITVEDGGTLIQATDSVILYNNQRVRRKVKEVVVPLTRDGVDELRYRMSADEQVIVTADEVAAFDPEVTYVAVSENTRDVRLTIVSPTFRDGNKWRFNDGGADFWAVIEDPEFLAKIDSHEETFGKNEILQCIEVTTQMQGSDGSLAAEHRITKVVDHILPHQQLRLPDREPPDAA